MKVETMRRVLKKPSPLRRQGALRIAALTLLTLSLGCAGAPKAPSDDPTIGARSDARWTFTGTSITGDGDYPRPYRTPFTPPSASRDTVITSDTERVYAVDMEGNTRWVYDAAPEARLFGPVIIRDGTAILAWFLKDDLTIQGRSVHSGETLWTHVSRVVSTVPVRDLWLVEDALGFAVVSGAPSDNLMQFTPEGRLLWQATTSSPPREQLLGPWSSPVTHGEGRVFVLTTEGLEAYRLQNGHRDWSRGFVSEGAVAPVVSDGFVFTTRSDLAESAGSYCICSWRATDGKAGPSLRSQLPRGVVAAAGDLIVAELDTDDGLQAFRSRDLSLVWRVELSSETDTELLLPLPGGVVAVRPQDFGIPAVEFIDQTGPRWKLAAPASPDTFPDEPGFEGRDATGITANADMLFVTTMDGLLHAFKIPAK